MREQKNAFHLAIPANDLDDAFDFYVTKLGCHLARRYSDRITLDFFGDQVVCHLSSSGQSDDDLDLYPRHFGITFRERDDFDRLLHLCKERELRFFLGVRSRFEGLVESHLTFVLRDPSNNLLEFKWYEDPRMMY